MSNFSTLFWRIHFQVLWHIEKCWGLYNDEEFKKKFWGTIAPFQTLLACMFVFPKEPSGEFDHLSFPKLFVGMHVNKTKFEINSSVRFHHTTLHWENKTFKLKGSFDCEVRHHLCREKFSPVEGSPSYSSYPRRATRIPFSPYKNIWLYTMYVNV